MLSGLHRYERYGPLLMRLGIGVIMLLSGYAKVTGLAGVTRFFTSIGIPAAGIMAPFVAYAELVGGALLIIGLGTRIIGVLFAVIMVVATFSAKWASATRAGGLDFNQIRLEYLIMLGSLALAFTGPGALSVDEGFTDTKVARTTQ